MTRLTKNVKSDLSRLSYSYFILRRGPRPAVVDEDRGEGRVGEVERELRLAREEKEGRTAVEGDDGVFALPDDAGAAAAAAGERAEADQVDYGKLRREIGEWGRVLRAPLHRKGHSEVDLCTAEGVSLALPCPIVSSPAADSPLCSPPYPFALPPQASSSGRPSPSGSASRSGTTRPRSTRATPSRMRRRRPSTACGA